MTELVTGLGGYTAQFSELEDAGIPVTVMGGLAVPTDELTSAQEDVLVGLGGSLYPIGDTDAA